jgi:putative ABC transport system permease protein
VSTLVQDVRYGARMLRKSPGFTIVAVITLALGIGANTAIFSIVNTVLLRPLPFPESDRLIHATETYQQPNGVQTGSAVSYPDFFDWRSRAQSFEGMASYHEDALTLANGTQPLHVTGQVVAGDFFSVLRAAPMLGRVFSLEDEKPGSHVVVLSHGLWQKAMHGDQDVIGRTVTLANQSYTVVGVMPTGFVFPLDTEPPELWRPLAADVETADPKDKPITTQRGAHFLQVVGRLKPGISVEKGKEEINVIAAALAKEYPDTNKKHPSAEVKGELEYLVGDTKPALIVLLLTVFSILLIACVNVANLLLVRCGYRAREMAVRASLGASRWRVVRQLFTESFLLAWLGALLSVPLAVWGVKGFIQLNANRMPRVGGADLDGRVLAFTFVVALITSVIFGLLPAFRAANPNLSQFLKDGGRGNTSGVSHQRLRGTLVVAETAIGLMLLVTAGLLLRSLHRLMQVDPGINTENVLTFTFDLPETKYSPERQVQFYKQLISQLRALPGVTSAGGVLPLPLSGDNMVISFQVDGRPVPKSEQPAADFRVITPDYFRALGIPLLKGREFNDHDDEKAQTVVVVNQAFVQKFFPNEDPIGKRIIAGASVHEEHPAREIVGVVGNVRHRALNREVTPEYYIPQAQLAFSPLTICVKTTTDPHSVAAAARGVVASMDSELPLYGLRTMDEYLSASVATSRFQTMLLEAFALLALLLTAVGLYGVVAYAVVQRTHEIGVRITLGATRGRILRLVLLSGFRLTAIGAVAGVLGSIIAARSLTAFTKLLYGVAATDTLTFAAVIGLLAAVSLLACYIPAYRASRVNPMVALRYE